MEIAVTTIAKNEEKYAQRWADTCRDADLRFVMDTGSTDATSEILLDNGVQVADVKVIPWRFDTARNLNLALIPDTIDVVLHLDMDEVLVPGWRELLEAAPEADQYTYDYQWSPTVFFRGEKCHRLGAYTWKHPVHEVLVAKVPSPRVAFGGFSVVHLPDEGKSREQYLPLLAMGVAESPNDDRLSHYYARELYFRGDWEHARKEFVRHLTLSTWAPERAQSYRYLAQMDDYPERWILSAIAEAPERREAWVDLIRLYKKVALPVDTLVARVLTLTHRPVDYITEGEVWDDTYIRSLL